MTNWYEIQASEVFVRLDGYALAQPCSGQIRWNANMAILDLNCWLDREVRQRFIAGTSIAVTAHQRVKNRPRLFTGHVANVDAVDSITGLAHCTIAVDRCFAPMKEHYDNNGEVHQTPDYRVEINGNDVTEWIIPDSVEITDATTVAYGCKFKLRYQAELLDQVNRNSRVKIQQLTCDRALFIGLCRDVTTVTNHEGQFIAVTGNAIDELQAMYKPAECMPVPQKYWNGAAYMVSKTVEPGLSFDMEKGACLSTSNQNPYSETGGKSASPDFTVVKTDPVPRSYVSYTDGMRPVNSTLLGPTDHYWLGPVVQGKTTYFHNNLPAVEIGGDDDDLLVLHLPHRGPADAEPKVQPVLTVKRWGEVEVKPGWRNRLDETAMAFWRSVAHVVQALPLPVSPKQEAIIQFCQKNKMTLAEFDRRYYAAPDVDGFMTPSAKVTGWHIRYADTGVPVEKINP